MASTPNFYVTALLTQPNPSNISNSPNYHWNVIAQFMPEQGIEGREFISLSPTHTHTRWLTLRSARAQRHGTPCSRKSDRRVCLRERERERERDRESMCVLNCVCVYVCMYVCVCVSVRVCVCSHYLQSAPTKRPLHRQSPLGKHVPIPLQFRRHCGRLQTGIAAR
jgi:hypothetical protein